MLHTHSMYLSRLTHKCRYLMFIDKFKVTTSETIKLCQKRDLSGKFFPCSKCTCIKNSSVFLSFMEKCLSHITFGYMRNFYVPIICMQFFKFRKTWKEGGRLKLFPISVACGLAVLFVQCSQSMKDIRFFRAAKYGPAEELKRMIVEDKVNVNQKHPLGWTALQVAIINNKMANAKVLLTAGADPNIPDDFSNVNKVAAAKRLYTLDGTDHGCLSFLILIASTACSSIPGYLIHCFLITGCALLEHSIWVRLFQKLWYVESMFVIM
ncbi:hypothetical protein J6590_045551 [Homalodisca vitripennis]|nr:hypothetical protein J6590_045551 [Homalodisca vitripennis]